MRRLEWTYIPEVDLDATLSLEICAMLVRAFPQHASFFAQHTYWGSTPEFRVIGRDSRAHIRAHAGFGRRRIAVGATDVAITGIGAVAVDPAFQGQGHGKALFANLGEFARMRKLADFGFLGCRQSVAPFYERVGFSRVFQPYTYLDPDTQTWLVHSGPVMVLPLETSIVKWPSSGSIHLRGPAW